MNLIGQAIEHSVLGVGTVADLSDGVLTVRFSGGEKKFIYPDAFRGFLVLRDSEAQRRIQAQLRERELARQQKRQEEQAEQTRRWKQQNFKITLNSHAVFHAAPEQLDRLLAANEIPAGVYESGSSRGLPRLPDKLKPNSACLLTEREKSQPELSRRIAGIFMVGDDYFGEDARDGTVTMHPQHRVLLPEARRPLFWGYLDPAVPPRWGKAAFKYCSVDVIDRVLTDILSRMAAGQEPALLELYRYFCKANGLSLRLGQKSPRAADNCPNRPAISQTSSRRAPRQGRV